MSHFSTRVCLVGHTHVPVLFSAEDENAHVEAYALEERHVLTLSSGRHILNPGSVGQPRDGDPRASYMLVDLESMSFELRRVEYPIARTQARMRESALPNRLITRLELGW